MSHTWKLRILNGEHAGAEVSLNQAMSLGRDEELSDLVLGDDFVSPCFFKLTPNELGIKVELLEESSDNAEESSSQETLSENKDEISKDPSGSERKEKPSLVEVCVDGAPIDQDEYAPVQKVIFVGKLAIALRSHEEEWSSEVLNFSKDSPQALDAEKPKEFRGSLTSEHVTTENTGKDSNGKSSFALTPLKASFFGGGILCAAILGIAFLKYFPSSLSSEQGDNTVIATATSNAAHSSEIDLSNGEKNEIDSVFSDLLSNPDYESVSLTQLGDKDQVYATGYVSDEVTLARFKQQLETHNLPLNISVYSTEQMRRSARLILANLGLIADDIKTQEEPGHFTAVVDGDYMEDWESAKTLLLADIPGLLAWDLEVEQKLTPLERLKQLAEKHSIAKRLSYVQQTDKIQIVARINSAQQKELVTLMEEFRTRVGDLPKLEYVVPTLPERSLTLNDFDIAAVRSGKNPYVTHQNGKRYLAGARLPNGIRIQSFSDGEVTVLRGSDAFVIRYEKTTTADTGTYGPGGKNPGEKNPQKQDSEIDDTAIAYQPTFNPTGMQK